MKLCNNCNAQLEDSAVFCNSCGVAQPQAQPAGAPQYQQAPQQPAYNGNINAPVMPTLYNDSPVMAVVRKIATSPMYLVMAIAFSVSLVLSFINSIVALGTVTKELTSFYTNDLYSAADIQDFFDEISVSSTGGVSLFSILTAVSLWLIFAAAKDRRYKMNTTGLKILKVIAVISLVLVCVLAGLVTLLLILLAVIMAVSGGTYIDEFNYDYSYGYDAAEALTPAAFMIGFIAISVVCAALFTFLIVYQAFMVKAINSAKKTVETEVPTVKGFGFVSVMCIISGAVNLVASLAYVIRPLILLTCLSTGLASLFAGLLLLRFKKEMEPFIIPPYMQYYQPAAQATPVSGQYGAQSEPVYQPVQNVEQPPVEVAVTEQPTTEHTPVEEQPAVESNDELK